MPLPPHASAPAPHQPWVPPIAWKIQLFTADGTVATELHKRPGLPHMIIGCPELFIHRAPEIAAALRFFLPPVPFLNSLN